MIRAQVIRYDDIDKRFPARDPDSRIYKCKVLAEGDFHPNTTGYRKLAEKVSARLNL
jgi:hypothetical protein